MANLTEEIGRICNLLEDAYEEQDWKIVKKMIDALDKLWDELDRAESGFIDFED
jgi:hypothetical protein